jgi:hypothetical protein
MRKTLSGKQMGSTLMHTLVLGCTSGARKWGITSVCRKICTFSNTQAAIKALNNFQVNSKLVFECHQSLVKMAEPKSFLLLWVQDIWKLMGMKWSIS